MPTGITAPDVVNGALSQIAAQTRITALNDGSPAALAASVVYAPTVDLMLRELDPDFARYQAVLAAAGGSLVVPWAYKYAYPTDCLRLRQVRPPGSGSGALADPFDPQAIRANVAMDVISSVPTKVILTNQQNALAVYTTANVTEALWDAVFLDAVVRRLANPLAMALSGRPDFAREILEQSSRMAATAEAVDDSGWRSGMRGV